MQGKTNNGLFAYIYLTLNNFFQKNAIKSMLYNHFQATTPLIQRDYCRGNIQCLRNSIHDSIENHRKIHLRSKSTGNILQFLALPILYFYTSTYLCTLDGCCQDMGHSTDESLERFIGVCINSCTTQF